MLANVKYLIILFSLILFSLDKNSSMRAYKITGLAQGTTYTASYFATDSLVTKAHIDSILNVIDLSMSLYQSQSLIHKFNAAQSIKVKVDEHMLAVLKKSFQINKETNGLFDITIQPLMSFWGFYSQNEKHLKQNTAGLKKQIDSVKKMIGMDKIKLSENFLCKKNKLVKIDLNGIAQGYTVDVVAEFFESKGIKSYVFELGGEIRANGPKPDGSLIKIGIEGLPENEFEEAKMKHIVSFTEGAITTSGSYNKFIVYQDKNYGHIINPKNGFPINSEMISVTVFAKKAIDADGYDNALMLMPVEEAIKFVEHNEDLEAYIIYKKADGKIADTLSTGFKKLIIN